MNPAVPTGWSARLLGFGGNARGLFLALIVLAGLTACSPSAETNDLDGTEWILTWLNGSSLLSGTNITLSFAEGQATGFAGCNAYPSPYTASRGALQVAQLAVTASASLGPAGVMQQEQLSTDKLQNAAACRIADERLEISSRAGATVLVFMKKERFAMNPHDLVNTKWQLVSANGDKAIGGSMITLEFIGESQVSGHAGCRDYWATYSAQGDASKFTSTGMLGEVCPSDASLEQEGNYTTMLSWTTNYRLAKDRLELSTARGEVLIYVSPGGEGPSLEPTSPAPGPTALPKPTLASPSPADASVLAHPEVIALLDVLRQHGIPLVNPSESRVDLLYPAPGVGYRVGRGGLAIHPFPNREAAEKRANEIPSELARPATGDWVDQPHFYRCKSTLVLHMGRDAKVMEALEEQGGPPFAGS